MSILKKTALVILLSMLIMGCHKSDQKHIDKLQQENRFLSLLNKYCPYSFPSDFYVTTLSIEPMVLSSEERDKYVLFGKVLLHLQGLCVPVDSVVAFSKGKCLYGEKFVILLTDILTKGCGMHDGWEDSDPLYSAQILTVMDKTNFSVVDNLVFQEFYELDSLFHVTTDRTAKQLLSCANNKFSKDGKIEIHRQYESSQKVKLSGDEEIIAFGRKLNLDSAYLKEFCVGFYERHIKKEISYYSITSNGTFKYERTNESDTTFYAPQYDIYKDGTLKK